MTFKTRRKCPCRAAAIRAMKTALVKKLKFPRLLEELYRVTY